MRATRAALCAGLTICALSAFGDDGANATFSGSWRSPGSSGNAMRRADISPSADGASVDLSCELSLAEHVETFKTHSALTGDTVDFEATLSGTGIVDRLIDRIEKPVTIKGQLVLEKSAGRIQASWTTSAGASGHDVLTRSGTGWTEAPMGGSPEAEAKIIADLANQVNGLQDSVAKGGDLQRGFHNKGFGVKATLRVLPEIAPDLRAGLFQPGAVYPAIARFSNAGAANASDVHLDQRGFAFRVKTGKTQWLLSGQEGDAQDFLTTNSPVTARDPVQFLAFARAQLDLSRFPSVVEKYGVEETAHIGATLTRGEDVTESMLTEKLWSSRAPIRWGPLAVKFQLTPSRTPKRADGPEILPSLSRDRLQQDLKERLAAGDAVLDMWIQRFDSEKTTPIEDGSVEWKTPRERVAQLVIAKQDLDDESATALAAEIEKMAFNPWNCTEDFRPLGSLMRARREVYKSSASHRGACPFGFTK